MSAVAVEDDDLLDDDLLPDDLLTPKKGAAPLKRTPKQKAALARRAEAKAEEDALAVQRTKAQERAARLAQIVNLHIAGFSLADIGASIGATESEVERMLTEDTQRYVRTQPALRTYVRNFISGKYNDLLEAVWDEATDKTHKEKLEHQDRALRILDRMARLHGAEAPTQTEVKVETAPEAVDKLVQKIAAAQGLGYDTSIFDVVPGQVVYEAVEASHAALEESSSAVEDSDGDDDL